MTEILELCGTLEKQIYKNPENGFAIFTLKVNSKETVTVQGILPEVHQGAQVTFKGKWTFHPKFGRQFQATECVAQLPSSVIGIQKYLSSGLIRGIGPKFAQRLVDYFGEKTLEIIDKDPEKLLHVDGVGPQRMEAITKAWQEQKEISRVMVFLKSKDVSTSFAVKIFKTYGNNSIEKIEQDPYRLVEDIWGIGFKSADKLAIQLGLENNSIKRIKSGILYCITEATNEGHLYLEVVKAKETCLKILELENNEQNQNLLKQALNELYLLEKIKLINYQEKSFITLPQYYFSEKGIANKILKFLGKPVRMVRQAHHERNVLLNSNIIQDTNIENQNIKNNSLDILSSDYKTPFVVSLSNQTNGHTFNLTQVYKQIRLPDTNNIELNEDQQKGILCCLQNKVTIITGGPGTGKTTLIKKLLDVLEDHKIKFRLAAPTGRAAKRMFEGTRRSTETLHRLLEFSPATMNFIKNEQNALDLEFLVVDEASMIDVFLMHSLLRALPDKAHLVLLGDIDQLPSVGAGNILHDMINSEKIPTIRLTQIFRQAQDSMIIVNAHNINKGEFPSSSIEGCRKDFVYLKENEPESIFPILHKIYKFKLAQRGIDPSNTVVLTPMNRGVAGTQRINQELQIILNPEKPNSVQIQRFGQVYRVGDRVMQIRNNYDKFVFNGDLGTISDIDAENQKMFVNFGERNLEYDFSELNELALSYAISIHKSQGSEFDAVIIPIFMQHFILLQRNLIYTAITRAKKLCVLIGQGKAIAIGIKNTNGNQRNTFLKEFLTTDLEAK